MSWEWKWAIVVIAGSILLATLLSTYFQYRYEVTQLYRRIEKLELHGGIRCSPTEVNKNQDQEKQSKKGREPLKDILEKVKASANPMHEVFCPSTSGEKSQSSSLSIHENMMSSFDPLDSIESFIQKISELTSAPSMEYCPSVGETTIVFESYFSPSETTTFFSPKIFPSPLSPPAELEQDIRVEELTSDDLTDIVETVAIKDNEEEVEEENEKKVESPVQRKSESVAYPEYSEQQHQQQDTCSLASSKHTSSVLRKRKLSELRQLAKDSTTASVISIHSMSKQELIDLICNVSDDHELPERNC